MIHKINTDALHLTLAEYDSMVQRGAFEDLNRKIELIYGELVEVPPPGPIHDYLITYLNNWSARTIDPEATLVTSQTGLDLPEQSSRPQPDLMWIRVANYRAHYPRAEDVQLAIEVAYSSLLKDMDTKGRLYAEAGIVEYWVVDAEANCIHVHRQPKGGRYQERFVVTTPGQLAPLAQHSKPLDLEPLFS